MPLRILNQTKNIVLATCAEVADTEHKRMRGLLDRVSLAPGEGLLIPKCNSIHTYGMRFPIDVLFVDWAGKVTSVYSAMQPRDRTTPILSNEDKNWAVELPSGMAQNTEAGDQLVFHRL